MKTRAELNQQVRGAGWWPINRLKKKINLSRPRILRLRYDNLKAELKRRRGKRPRWRRSLRTQVGTLLTQAGWLVLCYEAFMKFIPSSVSGESRRGGEDKVLDDLEKVGGVESVDL